MFTLHQLDCLMWINSCLQRQHPHFWPSLVSDPMATTGHSGKRVFTIGCWLLLDEIIQKEGAAPKASLSSFQTLANSGEIWTCVMQTRTFNFKIKVLRDWCNQHAIKGAAFTLKVNTLQRSYYSFTSWQVFADESASFLQTTTLQTTTAICYESSQKEVFCAALYTSFQPISYRNLQQQPTDWSFFHSDL